MLQMSSIKIYGGWYNFFIYLLCDCYVIQSSLLRSLKDTFLELMGVCFIAVYFMGSWVWYWFAVKICSFTIIHSQRWCYECNLKFSGWRLHQITSLNGFSCMILLVILFSVWCFYLNCLEILVYSMGRTTKKVVLEQPISNHTLPNHVLFLHWVTVYTWILSSFLQWLSLLRNNFFTTCCITWILCSMSPKILWSGYTLYWSSEWTIQAVVYPQLTWFFWLGVRVVLRRLSSQPQAKMLLCSLLELTRRNTSQNSTLFPMLVALQTALLLLRRFYLLSLLDNVMIRLTWAKIVRWF